MANLNEIAQLVYNQVTGGGNDETTVQLEELISTAKIEYAWQSLQLAWKEKREQGEYTIPSELLVEVDKEVKDNEIDISDLSILRSLPSEVWLQSVGGLICDCQYVKTTVNLAKVLCDDDSMGDNVRTFYVVGNKIKFPKGTHSKTLPIIYASNGSDVDDKITEVDDAVGALVRQRLQDIYLGKIAPQDTGNNSNPLQ